MKKIMEFFGSNVFKSISDLIDNLFTNDEERIDAKRRIFQVLKSLQ